MKRNFTFTRGLAIPRHLPGTQAEAGVSWQKYGTERRQDGGRERCRIGKPCLGSLQGGYGIVLKKVRRKGGSEKVPLLVQTIGMRLDAETGREGKKDAQRTF